MSKYDPIAEFLIDSDQELVSMTFEDIENVAGIELPESAYKYRAWWSNNGTNSAFTRVWLRAGYKTKNVDMNRQQLEFHKDSSTEQSLSRHKEVPEKTAESSRESQSGGVLSRMMGILEGTVTIYPETNLTEPAFDPEDWNPLKE